MAALRIVIIGVLFVLFLVTPAFAANHTVQGCFNSTHMEIEFTGTDKEAEAFQIVPETYIACPFGCDVTNGACRDMVGIAAYGWLMFAGQLIFLLFCLFMVHFWDNKPDYAASSIFKFMFLFMGLICIWSLFATVGTLGDGIPQAEIASASNIMFSWSGAVTYITIFFLFYFMALLLINMISILKERKEKGQKKLIGDLGELDVN